MKKVLSAIRLVLLGVVAISLAWIAFGKEGTEATDAQSPTANLVVASINAERRAIVNEVEAGGQLVAQPAMPAKATVDGKIRSLHAKVGDEVSKGQRIAVIATEIEPPPAPEPAEGEPAPAPPKPKIKLTSIKAPEAGRILSLPYIKNQPVSIGADLATLTTGALHVSASLSQADRFRLLKLPTSATVEVQGGPAPFACGNLRVGDGAGQDASSQSNDSGEYDRGGPQRSGGQSSGSLMCDVPADTGVFAGLSATMKITAGKATNVLTLPVTAVTGRVNKGQVWLQNPDGGEPIEKKVDLGLTDGKFIEITGGLTESDAVLEFAPGAREDHEGNFEEYHGGYGG